MTNTDPWEIARHCALLPSLTSDDVLALHHALESLSLADMCMLLDSAMARSDRVTPGMRVIVAHTCTLTPWRAHD